MEYIVANGTFVSVLSVNSRRVSISSTQSYFAYTASNIERSEVLNEAVMCTSSNSKV